MHQRLSEWLLPLGFVETFYNSSSVDFIKDQTRIRCSKKREECRICRDIINLEKIMTIKSGLIKSFTEEVIQQHSYFSKLIVSEPTI